MASRIIGGRTLAWCRRVFWFVAGTVILVNMVAMLHHTNWKDQLQRMTYSDIFPEASRTFADLIDTEARDIVDLTNFEETDSDEAILEETDVHNLNIVISNEGDEDEEVTDDEESEMEEYDDEDYDSEQHNNDDDHNKENNDDYSIIDNLKNEYGDNGLEQYMKNTENDHREDPVEDNSNLIESNNVVPVNNDVVANNVGRLMSQEVVNQVNEVSLHEDEEALAWLESSLSVQHREALMTDYRQPVKGTPPVPTKVRVLCRYLKAVSKMQYVVYRDVFKGNVTARTQGITLLTHMSMARANRMDMMAQNWEDPMSIAIWVPREEVKDALITWCKIKSLRSRDNIIVHVVIAEGTFYPSNYMRNIVMDAALTDLVFVNDIDAIPMAGTTAHLHHILRKKPLPEKHALVIPTFESLNYSVKDVPSSKEDLIRIWEDDLVEPFYKNRFYSAYCPILYTQWKTARLRYKVSYHLMFEPFVVIHKSQAPPFNPAFLGLYYDKASWSLHLFHSGFEFVVAPKVFNLHLFHEFTHDSSKDKHFGCMKKTMKDFMKKLQKWSHKVPLQAMPHEPKLKLKKAKKS